MRPQYFSLIFTVIFFSHYALAKSKVTEDKVLNVCNTIEISTCVAQFHPQKALIAVASYDTSLKLIDSATGKTIKTLEHPSGTPAIDFSQQGNKLVSGSYDHLVRVWNVNNGELESTLEGHVGNVFSVAFSSDNNIVASGGAKGQVFIWNLANNSHQELQGHEGDVWGMVFSPDGSLLLTGGEDDKIKIWDVTSGKLVRELLDHDGAVLTLTFSHDGTLLASGGDDYSIKLWDTHTWQNTHTIKGEFYSVYSLSFSPDDSVLASSGRDRSSFGEFFQHHFGKNDDKKYSVFFWDVASQQEILRLKPHHNDTKRISFDHTGEHFVTSSTDDNVIIHRWRQN